MTSQTDTQVKPEVRTERGAPVRCMEWLEVMRENQDDFIERAMAGVKPTDAGAAMLENIARKAYECGFRDANHWWRKITSNDQALP